MLVLARKPDEKVVIQTPAGKIVITCVRAGKREIRLGIDAPANCHVLRHECFLPLDETELVRETIREEWAA